MSIHPDLQKIIDDFAEAMNEKEVELTAFNDAIDVILDDAKKQMENKIVELDAKFQGETISEEEYLAEIKTWKTDVIAKTKQALEELVSNLQE